MSLLITSLPLLQCHLSLHLEWRLPPVSKLECPGSESEYLLLGHVWDQFHNFIILGVGIPCNDRDINNKIHGTKE
jgi:hypothetical protein